MYLLSADGQERKTGICIMAATGGDKKFLSVTFSMSFRRMKSNKKPDFFKILHSRVKN
jgi:hypothetical protein